MAQYFSGNETKKRIINACKDLFYNKGYKNTTYKDICKEAIVHPGSITHHFNNKINISAQIYNEFMTYYTKRVPRLFSKEDELTLLILLFCVHYRLFFDDALYRRFSIEFENDYFSVYDMTDYKKYFSHVYSYMLKIMDAKKADFYFAAYVGMDKGVQPYIDINMDSLTYKEAVTFTNELYFPFIPKEELNEKIQRALELMKTIEIKNKGFDITIIKK